MRAIHYRGFHPTHLGGYVISFDKGNCSFYGKNFSMKNQIVKMKPTERVCNYVQCSEASSF